MKDEIMKILTMVENKTIGAEEAAKLIDAIETSAGKDQWIDLNDDQKSSPEPSGKKPSWLYIMVDEGAEGSKKKSVRLRIPIKLARWALKFVPKSAQAKIKEKHGEDFDLSELGDLIDELPVGEDIINVTDENENVRIFLR